jgi:hypothetical protein
MLPNRCHPSVQPSRRKLAQTGATRQSNSGESKLGPPPNWCHPSVQPAPPSWCHPSAGSVRGRIGATRKLVPPVIPTWVVGDLVPPLGPNGRTGATRQLTSGERQAGATRASESVPLASPSRTNWCYPCVQIRAIRQSKSGGEPEWCNPRVQRKRFGPALGFVFGRQTAAVGAGPASLLAYSAAEYPAWLILLKLTCPVGAPCTQFALAGGHSDGLWAISPPHFSGPPQPSGPPELSRRRRPGLSDVPGPQAAWASDLLMGHGGGLCRHWGGLFRGRGKYRSA